MSKIRWFKKEKDDINYPIYVKPKKLGLSYAGLKGVFPYINVWFQIKHFHLFRTLWEAIKSIHLWIKYKHQRMKYGISEFDCFSLDTYMEVVFKNAVKMLNNGRWGYPPNMTDEEWEEKLQWLISKLEFIIEDDYDNYYWDNYQNVLEKCGFKECPEVIDARNEWSSYIDTIERLKVDARGEVFDFLKEYWTQLWD